MPQPEDLAKQIQEMRVYQSSLERLVSARTEQLRAAVLDLERCYDITLEALGDALLLRDGEIEGHSKRVTAYTLALARAIELPREQMAVIARGAFLHDIGKLGMPDSVLRKPAALDAAEVALMREHCFLGYKLVERIPFLRDAADIVHSHHERYDGTGYPRGLKGDEIPLGARIVAVVEALDVLTSETPYRGATTLSKAKTEIQLWSGRQFDPQVVAKFLEMPEHVWDDMRREVARKRANI